jgi:hypothetical protein
MLATTVRVSKFHTLLSAASGTFTTNRTWLSLSTELMDGKLWLGSVTIALGAIVMALASALLI